MKLSPILALSCKLHIVPRFAYLSTVIANEVVAFTDHELICPNDNKGLGYVLHPRRIEGAVVAACIVSIWIIRYQQGQHYFRVMLFCFSDGVCGEGVKVTVMPHNKFADSVLDDVSLNRLIKHGMSHATVQRLQKDMPVSTHTLNKLCEILDCRLDEVAEYVPEK